MTTAVATIVLTCRNQGPQLDLAVQSIRESRHVPRDLIVVDDWSEDVRTCELLDTLARTGHRVVRAPRRGRPTAWNVAIAATDTPYVALFDVTDRVSIESVQSACHGLEHSAAAFVLATDESLVTSLESPRDVFGLLMYHRLHVPAVLRRELWNVLGGFDVDLCEVAALDFWISAVERGFGGQLRTQPSVDTCAHARPDPADWLSLSSERRRDLMTKLYQKHWSTVEAHAEALLLAKEELLLELRTGQENLHGRRHHLERRREDLDLNINNALHLGNSQAKTDERHSCQ